jgi:hypothetical protein
MVVLRPMLAAFVLALLPLGARPTLAQPAVDPDWPCQQRFVPEISSGQVWAVEPRLDQVQGDWRQDPPIAALAAKLASRDTPLDQAGADARAFIESLPEAGRQNGAALLFKGELETINGERDELLRGIRRFAQGQQKLAKRISGESVVAATPEAADRRHWDMRIYDDRQHSLYQLCNQPVLLEQRAFQLGRSIQGLIGG